MEQSRITYEDDSDFPPSLLRYWNAPATNRYSRRISNFKHTPLDYREPSIRLVKVHPPISEYDEDNIQCEIRHATTASRYTCLSYVWGVEDEGYPLLLNDEEFMVRDNLWRFLKEARKKPHICNEWLWIDALCIDQASNAERTHQVQHMGRIFSGAERVISWLGVAPDIVMYLHSIREQARIREARPKSEMNLPYFGSYMEVSRFDYRGDQLLRDDFNSSDYWRRAWITQEVALARDVTFMVGDVEEHESLVEQARHAGCFVTRDLLSNRRQNTQIIGQRLMTLLDRHKEKQCSILRDRIYSLLAICGDISGLDVDYEVPDRELADNVLRHCKDSFCLCAIAAVGDSLELSHGLSSYHNAGPETRHPEWFAYIKVPLLSHEDESGPSEYASAVYREVADASGHKSTSILIYPEEICPRYHSLSMTFTVESALGGIGNDTFILTAGNLEADKQKISGCMVELWAGRCTIVFTFEALLNVSRQRIRRGERRCGRERTSRLPLLKLCPTAEAISDFHANEFPGTSEDDLQPFSNQYPPPEAVSGSLAEPALDTSRKDAVIRRQLPETLTGQHTNVQTTTSPASLHTTSSQPTPTSFRKRMYDKASRVMRRT